MKLITPKKQFDVIDSYLYENALRIQVRAICNLEKIQNQYFLREKSFRKIYYYSKEIGIRNTILKILSRSREKIRNEKYFSIGIGKVLQCRSDMFSPSETVFFIATNHPACPERVITQEELVFRVNPNDFPWLSSDHIVWFSSFNQEKWWNSLLGWSPYSGLPIKNLDRNKIVNILSNFWKSIIIDKKNHVSIQKSNVVSEIKLPKTKIKLLLNQKTAALFGYGNYAKTIIIPNLHKNIRVTTTHEVDPTQLIPYKKNIIYDASPAPRPNTHHDVYFIAGYHHTHTDIAIAGLKIGADVVVEKPLMTTKMDLEKLISVMRYSSSKFYACFQRRHHPFNNFFFQDHGINQGDPISYYAIVYEEFPPELHWYRWPNSRSAIISNGCHWIDHFIFLNNFSSAVTAHVRKTKNDEIFVFVELENGACFSLVLSQRGSARIGMQEYIELRSRSGTAKISNGGCYYSENKHRIIRRSKINKYESYKKMYRSISSDIMDQGISQLQDSWERVQIVSSLVLELDEMLQGSCAYVTPPSASPSSPEAISPTT